MLTEFGKLLRKIRIDTGELLKDMADKLGVTPSYLSAVETGKRNVPEEWPDKLAYIYNLNTSQKKELEDTAYSSKLQVKFDMNNLVDNDKNLILSFAREFKQLDTDEKDKILSILRKHNNRQ